MSIIADFKDRLAAQGVGTYATDLFTGRLPGTPGTAVSITQVGGFAPARHMGSGTAVVHYTSQIQVMVRGATYDAMTAKALAVIAALDNFVGTIGSTRYLHIGLSYGPLDLGQDENLRFRASLVFQARSETL